MNANPYNPTKSIMKGRNSMQTVAFRNVDEFLEYLPEDELRVTEALRSMVFSCIPGVEEKLNYNVPYYKRHRNICFIWPAAILWGKTKSYKGVRFGFTSGYLLADGDNYLEKGGRKQVYWKEFSKVSDIDVPVMRSLLFEALLVDDETATKKTARRI